MSDFKVPYTKILNIGPHNNAERLEVATVYGFQVICGKGQYQVGDKVVYIPIDSILPQQLEDKLFPEGSKIKLHHHRVRQIRIRGLASQGMLVNPNDLAELGLNLRTVEDEQDVSEAIGVTKYDPPQPGPAQTQGNKKNRNPVYAHPLFHKYNGLDSIKWFPSLFKDDELVVIQEKLHGTNARASRLPYNANTLFKKLKKLLGLAPKYENCYGSNNVDISSRGGHAGYYGEDVYGAVFSKMDIFKKIPDGFTVYGEIIGPNIQKNYDYGLKEHKFVLFDVKQLMDDGKQRWLAPNEVKIFARQFDFELVPELYVGLFNKEKAYELTKGPSVYSANQKVREGIVIKSLAFYDQEGNKRALKWVSEDYLDDKNNTDFH